MSVAKGWWWVAKFNAQKLALRTDAMLQNSCARGESELPKKASTLPKFVHDLGGPHDLRMVAVRATLLCPNAEGPQTFAHDEES